MFSIGRHCLTVVGAVLSNLKGFLQATCSCPDNVFSASCPPQCPHAVIMVRKTNSAFTRNTSSRFLLECLGQYSQISQSTQMFYILNSHYELGHFIVPLIRWNVVHTHVYWSTFFENSLLTFNYKIFFFFGMEKVHFKFVFVFLYKNSKDKWLSRYSAICCR